MAASHQSISHDAADQFIGFYDNRTAWIHIFINFAFTIASLPQHLFAKR
jgi:hypothetical protein